jgi:hypothetical protein
MLISQIFGSKTSEEDQHTSVEQTTQFWPNCEHHEIIVWFHFMGLM